MTDIFIAVLFTSSVFSDVFDLSFKCIIDTFMLQKIVDLISNIKFVSFQESL